MAGEFREHSVGDRKYLVYVPEVYKAGTPCPAILFLHGAGESGSDPGVHKPHSLGKAVQEHPERWPFLIVFPQKLDIRVLWPGYRGFLNEILAQVEKDYSIDSKHTYLTGLSQGGNGTFELATRLRWDFAAAAPICGWADPMEAAMAMARVPMWVFHGTDDGVVPESCSRAIVDIARRFGDVKYTTYDNVGHNSWDPAYAEAELPQWLLRHGR